MPLELKDLLVFLEQLVLKVQWEKKELRVAVENLVNLGALETLEMMVCLEFLVRRENREKTDHLVLLVPLVLQVSRERKVLQVYQEGMEREDHLDHLGQLELLDLRARMESGEREESKVPQVQPVNLVCKEREVLTETQERMVSPVFKDVQEIRVLPALQGRQDPLVSLVYRV